MFSGIPSYLRKFKGLVSTKEQIDAAVAKANSIQDVNAVIAGLTVTGEEINEATNYVNGNAEITSYPINFTPLVSSSGMNNIYMNNNPISSVGSLKSLRVKSDIGSTITAYVYTVSGTSGSYSFTLLHTYEAKVTTAIEETLTYTDTYEIPIGAYIAVGNTSDFYFASNTYASKRVGATTDQDVILAFDFVIEKQGDVSLDLKITDINNNINELKKKKFNKSVLYKNPMTALSDFEQVNWSVVSGGLAPTVSTETSYLWLKKKYHLEDILYSFDIVLRTASIFVIEFESLTYPQGNGKFKINFATNKLEIYNDVSGVETLVSNTTISFALVDNTKYTIQIKKQNGVNLEIKIIDIATGNSSMCSYIANATSLTTQNRMMDSIKFYQQSGSSFNVVSNLLITSVKNPLVYLGGDSISEGVYFDEFNYSSRYGILLKNALDGNLIVSARGGATLAEIAERVTTEIQFVKPEFVMLTIGTNGGIIEANLISLVSSIEALGSKVIINHVPNMVDASHIATNNTIDNVCKTTNAILGAKFDIATSIAGNPANSYIAANYFDAGVHPNAIGQIAMYNRFEIDCPYLFLN